VFNITEKLDHSKELAMTRGYQIHLAIWLVAATVLLSLVGLTAEQPQVLAMTHLSG